MIFSPGKLNPAPDLEVSCLMEDKG